MAPAPPASEPIAVGEQLMQLDQAITLTLQEIDENFSQAHQVITSRILPAIHAYEAACQRTWSAAQFWKQFFETSAQVSLSHQPLEGTEEAQDTDASAAYAYDTDADTTTHERDVPVDDDSAHDTHDSNPLQSPPRLSHSIYAPRGRQRVAARAATRRRAVARAVPRRRPPHERAHGAVRGVHVDGNDPSVTIGEVPTSSSPWKRNARRRSSARPRVDRGQRRGGEPVCERRRPHAWDGIADLRTTPLRAGAPTRRTDAAHEDDTSMQLPHGMSSRPSRCRSRRRTAGWRTRRQRTRHALL
ncbi:ASK1 [Malassezia furfur]|nr:ASK1 [Malassezia furfur]